MEGAPMWKDKEITLDDAPDEPQILFYRDIEECCDHLQGNPSFSDAWDTAPKKVKYSGTHTRIYHDPNTADLWWTYQVNIGCLTEVASSLKWLTFFRGKLLKGQ